MTPTSSMMSMPIPIPQGCHIQGSFMAETPIASLSLAGDRQPGLIPRGHTASENTHICKAFRS
jgi:hypothetical protein